MTTPESLTISDRESASTAKILVGFGFNCYSFVTEGQELIWAHENVASGDQRPSGSGIPILFPFPGRIQGTQFEYAGKNYELEAGDALGNAIHGFVFNRPWRVVDHDKDRVTGEFQASVDDPSLLARWPADFKITAEYRLDSAGLKLSLGIENPDDKPLPFGLGTHPYFRIPLGPQGKAEECKLRIQAREYWELENMLPTGRVITGEGANELTSPTVVAENQWDTVYRLEPASERYVTMLEDPVANKRLEQTFDDRFKHCVVYTPPHREAICIEPYTTVPDAFRLRKQGVETDLLELAPGEKFEATVVIAFFEAD